MNSRVRFCLVYTELVKVSVPDGVYPDILGTVPLPSVRISQYTTPETNSKQALRLANTSGQPAPKLNLTGLPQRVRNLHSLENYTRFLILEEKFVFFHFF